MAHRHQMRRQHFLALGLCPECAGKEPLLKGHHYGANCQARRCKGSVAPMAPIPLRSVWDCPETGLDRAIREADALLALAPG